MLDLQIDVNKYYKIGLGLLVGKFLPLLVILSLAILIGISSLADRLWLAILLFLIAAPVIWQVFKVGKRLLAYFTIGRYLKVTIGKDDVTGTGALGKPIAFKKSEILHVIFDEPVDTCVATFTLKRPAFKAFGKARHVIYDFYLTEQSYKDLKKQFSYRWGGSIRTTQVKGKDVLAWRDEK
jgi:hypothetical protein